MSPRLEFEGKDVEKASQKACEELKIPKEKLKYDVISYGIFNSSQAFWNAFSTSLPSNSKRGDMNYLHY
ncbi:MAG: Jag N-terminal domain-containing protein [Proteobacteria bacterium]|nr:Jag N-terminal domain-containing protein [Pseudomonadota bacterium]